VDWEDGGSERWECQLFCGALKTIAEYGHDPQETLFPREIGYIENVRIARRMTDLGGECGRKDEFVRYLDIESAKSASPAKVLNLSPSQAMVLFQFTTKRHFWSHSIGKCSCQGKHGRFYPFRRPEFPFGSPDRRSH
jgi:hypothetical protein